MNENEFIYKALNRSNLELTRKIKCNDSLAVFPLKLELKAGLELESAYLDRVEAENHRKVITDFLTDICKMSTFQGLRDANGAAIFGNPAFNERYRYVIDLLLAKQHELTIISRGE